MALQNHRRNLLHRNRFRLIAQDGCFKQYIDIVEADTQKAYDMEHVIVSAAGGPKFTSNKKFFAPPQKFFLIFTCISILLVECISRLY